MRCGLNCPQRKTICTCLPPERSSVKERQGPHPAADIQPNRTTSAAAGLPSFVNLPVRTNSRDADPRSEVFLNANGAGGFLPPAPKTAKSPCLRLWLYRDFDYPVPTLPEQLVGVDDLVQGKRVRD
jgi:hypothetical protein